MMGIKLRIIMSQERNKLNYLSKQSLERNERYTSKSVLDIGEQLAARFREKRPLFPEKRKPKKKEIYEINKTHNTNWKQKVK